MYVPAVAGGVAVTADPLELLRFGDGSHVKVPFPPLAVNATDSPIQMVEFTGVTLTGMDTPEVAAKV